MVKRKKTGTLIVLSGPSGAGKGTICNELLKQVDTLSLSISMTTRSPRGNEVDGKDYYFVTKEQFEEDIKKGNFLEYAKVMVIIIMELQKGKLKKVLLVVKI